VRERVEELDHASADVVLFCEYFPHSLHDWLNVAVGLGDDAIDAACAMVEPELLAVASVMSANGLLHFDAHFMNILTDGSRLYLADFGLSTSTRFELSAAESEFVRLNATHDVCYLLAHLVNWLVTALAGTTERADRVEYVRRIASGAVPEELPPGARAIVERYAPIAVVINEFYGNLYFDDRAAPYPAEALQKACAAAGFRPVP